ncbi:WXG100 family type VII secretion target [Corynebacterium uterequi]|uniref:ESAT-6-like protein n=1 Tax=Corynebacterium uterequi TaxID=1072256 RepID=A0A0G3HCI6_9CORY|nr:WXG100 family type VII secretion target [Corynebacterium uterequi]AKK10415.1 WXG100 family type VII secretion target [Corynebacterium uterequi]
MSFIKYQFGEIDSVAGDIRTTAGRIGSELDALKADLRPMVDTWEGDSSEAYQARQAEWDAAAAELNIILQSITQALSEGNTAMSDINQAAARSWN